MTREEFKALFIPGNERLDKRKVHGSPTGRYALMVDSFASGPGSWDVTRGTVHEGDRFVAVVLRNYHGFPFAFIEGHAKGDFLVCGEHYMHQTVVDLADGKLWSGSGGDGFCWGEYRYHPEAQVMVVNGCYWACNGEYKFFDFSDPLRRGWPEIKAEGVHFEDSDAQWPTVDAGGVVKYFHHSDEDGDENDGAEVLTATVRTFRRDGMKLVEEKS
jgi:hypothetical protein